MTTRFQQVRILPPLTAFTVLVVLWSAGVDDVNVWLLGAGVGGPPRVGVHELGGVFEGDGQHAKHAQQPQRAHREPAGRRSTCAAASAAAGSK